jgi:hypothetical protein
MQPGLVSFTLGAAGIAQQSAPDPYPPLGVMPALLAGIHVFCSLATQFRRGWP